MMERSTNNHPSLNLLDAFYSGRFQGVAVARMKVGSYNSLLINSDLLEQALWAPIKQTEEDLHDLYVPQPARKQWHNAIHKDGDLEISAIMLVCRQGVVLVKRPGLQS